MDFAGDMPPGLNLGGQENDGMTTVANAAINNDVMVLEELDIMLEQARGGCPCPPTYLDLLLLQIAESVGWLDNQHLRIPQS